MEVASLFSGCGGTDLGFMNAGHDLILANDIDKWACSSYESNLGIKPTIGDISKIESFPRADILVGCYPCQGFSIYGARRSNDPRNSLYLQFIRALRQSKPKFFLTENVKGLLFGYGKVILKDMLKEFKASNYELCWKLVNAKDYGIPQDRERVIIVGRRKDLVKSYEFPEPTHGENLKPYTTLRDCIGDFGKPKEGEVFDDAFSSHYMSRNRKRRWNQVSFTIQASGRHAPLHPSGRPMAYVKQDVFCFVKGPNRRLSYKECAAIQSFPGDWDFDGPLDKKYRQIGNAVPPLLAQVFAEHFY
jgi:DNA (cytosine-5)-methyltransferase 1